MTIIILIKIIIQNRVLKNSNIIRKVKAKVNVKEREELVKKTISTKARINTHKGDRWKENTHDKSNYFKKESRWLPHM